MARKRKRSPLLPLLVLLAALGGLAYVLLRDRGRVPDEGDGPPPLPAVAGAATAGRKVIFIGLDGADWELLSAYIDAGAMPELAALVAEGRPGILDTLEPPLSPLVWTTMMTGVSPLEHGVLDFTRFNPQTRAREPITREERRVPALWNMASAGGKRVAVFGLWATWPAEPVAGLMVSDRLVATRAGEDVPPAAVYPPQLAGWVRDVQTEAENAVGHEALAAYLPGLGADEERHAETAAEPLGHPVSGLRRILVETRAVHALASRWIAAKSPDLAIVYFQGTDLVGHLFAPYAPPRRPGISDEDFARYGNVPALYFKEIDRLLGEYRHLAEQQGAVLMLASDHGFAWGKDRPRGLASQEAATAGQWHRKQGMSLLWGAGVVPGPGEEESVDKVCSTVLALLGLPRGTGLAEPPLAGVAAGNAVIDYRPAYRQQAATVRASSEASEQALKRLEALGYLGSSEVAKAPDDRLLAEATRTPGSFNNEGLILRGWGETARATEAFEKALRLDPSYPSALWNLSDLLFSQGGDRDKADRLLLQAAASGLPQGAEHVVGRARAWHQAGQLPRSLALLDSAVAKQPNEPTLRLWRGRFRMDLPDCPGALADFVQAAALAPADPMIQASLGLARGCVGDSAGAREALQRSLLLDPNQPELRAALAGLGGAGM